MRKFIPFLFALAVVFAISCKNTNVKEEINEVRQAEEKRNRYTAADGHTTGINVNLDRGKKWLTNSETKTGIAKMLGIIVDFTPNPTVEDYRAIYKKLATEYQSIIQKCTMKGNARMELQNYLVPLLMKFNTLAVGNLEECNETLPDIKDYLLKFSHFFF